jgi:hypothetical protein
MSCDGQQNLSSQLCLTSTKPSSSDAGVIELDCNARSMSVNPRNGRGPTGRPGASSKDKLECFDDYVSYYQVVRKSKRQDERKQARGSKPAMQLLGLLLWLLMQH